MRGSKTAIGIVLAALAVGVAASPTRAQEVVPLGEQGTHFLAEAIRGGLAEVELAKAAQQKAANSEVKQFAERVVRDHSAVNDKLMELAKKHKIEVDGTYGTPPLRPPQEAKGELQQLSGMSGEKFDQAFVSSMVEDHQKAIALYKEQAEKGKNEEIGDLVSVALPVLEAHLEMARSLSGKVGASR